MDTRHAPLWAGAILLGQLAIWSAPPHAAASDSLAAAIAEPVAPTRALSLAIDDLFSRMATAVMAGDQRAYLDLIDRSDPFFHQEQINWAKDLDRGLPAAFEMALVSDPSIVRGRDADGSPWQDIRAMVEMRYTPGGEGRRHEPRTIRYRARFIPAPGAAALDAALGDRAEGTVGPLLYAGEAWEVLERGSIRVLFAPRWRETAQIAADALPPIRTHVDLQMGADLSHQDQAIKLYGDMQHLQASIYLSYTDGLSGWNEPGEAIKIMAREPRGPRMLDNLLAHEYGHVATFAMGDHASAMAWWVLEGIADYVSGAYRADQATPGADPARDRPIPENLARTLRAWAEQGRLPAWEELADFHTVDPRWTGNVYTQGNHMIAYITHHFGVRARNDWLRAMARGASLDDATRDVLGLDGFGALDARWRASLRPDTEAPDT